MSLLHALPDTLLYKLRSSQNATTWLITGTCRCNHIKPVLHQLHWLPVRRHVEFRVACLVHQSLFGQAPGWWLQAHVWDRSTWSAISQCLDMYGAADTKQLQWRKFCHCCPVLVEQPATSLWHESSYEQFKRQLKMLFGYREHGSLWHI